MQLCFFQSQSRQKNFKLVLKALVVFILSVLLVAPTPVLALVNTERLQDYASSVRSEIKGLFQSIENLPSQSNDEAFKTLASIEASIDRLSDNAAKRAEEFQAKSNEEQKKLSRIIDKVNTIYQEQQKLRSNIENVNVGLVSVKSLQTSTKQEVEKLQPEYDRMNEQYYRNLVNLVENGINSALFPMPVLAEIYPEVVDARVFSSLEDNLRKEKDQLEHLKCKMRKLEEQKRKLSSEISQKQEQIKELKDTQKKLEIEEQALAAGVVMANEISVTCNSLKPKLVQAKNRTQDVRDTAEYFEGFNNSGEELMDLKKSVDKLEEGISELDIYINHSLPARAKSEIHIERDFHHWGLRHRFPSVYVR